MDGRAAVSGFGAQDAAVPASLASNIPCLLTYGE